MTLPFWIENAFFRASDFLSEKFPRPEPAPEKFINARLISHRGIYDNRRVYENTLPAFDQAKTDGIWGIEFDIQWTRDMQPVVSHDPDCRRLFKENASIGELSLKALKSRFPMIPPLADVIQRYGGKLHLMAEMKPHSVATKHLNAVLSELFSSLQPARDFHLLSLHPQLLSAISCFPPETMIPIAETNSGSISDMVLQRGYGGMAGHYMLLQKGILRKLSRNRISVGTGFINSKNCLYREVNRGITWIFSDCATELRKFMPNLTEPPELIETNGYQWAKASSRVRNS
ncbi:MAG: glycerophosphodiester phosphodiesterase [Deltaproteobacteria bacterium]|nr:glycerophosphodiester phosphodiesterase [Deltaproteobacteria bacterium]